MEFVSNLTLAEKVNLTTGAGYVIPTWIDLICERDLANFFPDGSKSDVLVRLVVFLGESPILCHEREEWND